MTTTERRIPVSMSETDHARLTKLADANGRTLAGQLRRMLDDTEAAAS